MLRAQYLNCTVHAKIFSDMVINPCIRRCIISYVVLQLYCLCSWSYRSGYHEMGKFGFHFQFYFVVIQVPKDPVKDERTVTIQRVLDQEKAFWKVNTLKCLWSKKWLLLIQRLVKVKKNGIYLFGISFFILEIFVTVFAKTSHMKSQRVATRCQCILNALYFIVNALCHNFNPLCLVNVLKVFDVKLLWIALNASCGIVKPLWIALDTLCFVVSILLQAFDVIIFKTNYMQCEWKSL